MAGKENTGDPRSNEDAPRIYGFVLAMNENAAGVQRVFGIGKNVVNLGRGSRNDIRLNARMFSRLHVTISISEEDDGTLKVELKNQSTQKNATRAPYVLPFGNSVYLDSPSVFLLQGRRFQWIENSADAQERVQNMCEEPIYYISSNMKLNKGEVQVANDKPASNVVEYGSSSSSKSPSSQSHNSPKSTPSRKHRSSMNASLELRKAAIRRSFRSSLQQHMNQSTASLPTVMEEGTQDAGVQNDDQGTPRSTRSSVSTEVDLINLSGMSDAATSPGKRKSSTPVPAQSRTRRSSMAREMAFAEASRLSEGTQDNTNTEPNDMDADPTNDSVYSTPTADAKKGQKGTPRPTRSSVASEVNLIDLSSFSEATKSPGKRKSSTPVPVHSRTRRSSMAREMAFADASMMSEAAVENTEEIDEDEDTTNMSISTPNASVTNKTPKASRSTRSSVASVNEVAPSPAKRKTSTPVPVHSRTRRSSMAREMAFADASMMSEAAAENTQEIDEDEDTTNMSMSTPNASVNNKIPLPPRSTRSSVASVNEVASSSGRRKTSTPVPVHSRTRRSSMAREMAFADASTMSDVTVDNAEDNGEEAEEVNDSVYETPTAVTKPGRGGTPSSTRSTRKTSTPLATPSRTRRSAVAREMAFADASTLTVDTEDDTSPSDGADEETADDSVPVTSMVGADNGHKATPRSTRASIANDVSMINVSVVSEAAASPSKRKTSTPVHSRTRRSSMAREMAFAEASRLSEGTEDNTNTEPNNMDADTTNDSVYSTPTASAKNGQKGTPRSTRASEVNLIDLPNFSEATKSPSKRKSSTPVPVHSRTRRSSMAREMAFADASMLSEAAVENTQEIDQDEDTTNMFISTPNASVNNKTPLPPRSTRSSVASVNEVAPSPAKRKTSTPVTVHSRTRRSSMAREMAFADASMMSEAAVENTQEIYEDEDTTNMSISTPNASVNNKTPKAPRSTRSSVASVSEVAPSSGRRKTSTPVHSETRRSSMAREMAFDDASTMSDVTVDNAEDNGEEAEGVNDSVYETPTAVTKPGRGATPSSTRSTRKTSTPLPTPSRTRRSAVAREMAFADASMMSEAAVENTQGIDEDEDTTNMSMSAPNASVNNKTPLPPRSTRSSVASVSEVAPSSGRRKTSTPVHSETRRSSMAREMAFADASTLTVDTEDDTSPSDGADEETADNSVPVTSMVGADNGQKATPRSTRASIANDVSLINVSVVSEAAASPSKRKTSTPVHSRTRRSSMAREMPFAEASMVSNVTVDNAEDNGGTPISVPSRTRRSSMAREMAFAEVSVMSNVSETDTTAAAAVKTPKAGRGRRNIQAAPSEAEPTPTVPVEVPKIRRGKRGVDVPAVEPEPTTAAVEPEPTTAAVEPEPTTAAVEPPKARRGKRNVEVPSTDAEPTPTAAAVVEAPKSKRGKRNVEAPSTEAEPATAVEVPKGRRAKRGADAPSIEAEEPTAAAVKTPKAGRGRRNIQVAPTEAEPTPTVAAEVPKARRGKRGVDVPSVEPEPTTTAVEPPKARRGKRNVEVPSTEAEPTPTAAAVVEAPKSKRGKRNVEAPSTETGPATSAVEVPKGRRAKRGVDAPSTVVEEPAAAAVKTPKATRGKRNVEVPPPTTEDEPTPIVQEAPKARRGKRNVEEIPSAEAEPTPTAVVVQATKLKRGKRAVDVVAAAEAEVAVEAPKSRRGKRKLEEIPSAEVEPTATPTVQEAPKARRGKRNVEVPSTEPEPASEAPKARRGKRGVDVASTEAEPTPKASAPTPKARRGNRGVVAPVAEPEAGPSTPAVDVPKRKRGNRAAVDTPSVEIEPAVAPAKVEKPKSTRGKRNNAAVEVMNTETEPASVPAEVKTPKRTRAKRGADTPAAETESVPVAEAEEVQAPKPKRGKRVAAAATPVPTPKAPVATPKVKRSRKAPTTSETEEAATVAEIAVVEAPKARRGKRAAAQEDPKEEAAEPTPKGNQRGKRQKTTAVEAKPSSPVGQRALRTRRK